MSDQAEFMGNYSDLSTDRGFQFEFNCDRCSHAYRTRYKAWTVGSVSSLLDAAGSLLGGMFASAPDVGEQARSAGWQKAHDDAFAEAAEESRGSFIQCPRCRQWVCRRACWNTPSGLCKECAPDRRVEASPEGQRLSEAREGGAMEAACPTCGTPRAASARFCPECGAKL